MYQSEIRVPKIDRTIGLTTDYPICRSMQETYSWRTGRPRPGIASSSNVVQPPPRLSTDSLLGDKLRARRQYYEEIGDNLVSQNRDTPSSLGTSRFLTHDTGHSFSSVKYVHSGSMSITDTIDGKVAFKATTAPWFTEFLEVPIGAVIKHAPDSRNFARLYRFADNSRFDVTIGPSSAQRVKDQQGLFSSARPDASIAGWGETIIELLSGNLPKVVTSLGRSIASGRFMHQTHKGNLKDLSDDYLNQLFGWSPIIRDLEATVRHLLQLHSFLYDTSYRRQRSVPKRNESHLTRYNMLSGTPGIAPGFGLATVGRPTSGKNYVQTFSQTYDTRLSARFTRARASDSANSFADRGLEILQELGVGYPSLAWDIIPYSFLVDWVVSIGKGIDNYSTYSRANGSFLTDYAYATTKVIASRSVDAGIDVFRTATRQTVHSWTYAQQSTISTIRTAATPFGFGVTLPTLSASQYAILVALGLARSR